MKTKNMRKKALISSLAMLLVAVVALGGATYAWFTTSSSVSATGVELKTQAASNLQIKAFTTGETAVQAAEAEGWTNTIALGKDGENAITITPASSSDGEHFFGITTSGDGLVAPSENDFIVTAIGAGSYTDIDFWVRTQQDTSSSQPALKVKSIYRTDGSSTADVRAAGDPIWNGLRVAVLVDGTLQYVCAPANDTTQLAKGVLADGTSYTTTASEFLNVGELYAGTSAKATTAGVVFETLTANANYKSSTAYPNTGIQNMSSGTAYHITLRLWLEGNTTTGAAMNKDLNGIAFELGT